MASSKNRQRALARAKVERQIARRAAVARRRRQRQAALGAALAVILVVVGIVWATGGFSRPKKDVAAKSDCAWTKADSANPDIKDVGTPPTEKIARAGSAVMTITTGQGVIEAVLDRAQAPCTVTSFEYLAGKNFFDNSKCHRLTTGGLFVLQCGDPSGTGRGGPAYKFPTEFVPTAAEPSGAPDPSAPAAGSVTYSRGMLAMANSGPDTNGSQFFIVYKDSKLPPNYTVFGTVTKGLDVVDRVAAAGVTPSDPSKTDDGAPKTEVVIRALTVGPGPATPAPAPSTPEPASPTPAPSAAPSSKS